MRQDREFILQPQRLLLLTFSLNGGFCSIPSGRFADCRSCSLLARGAAWLADSNCGSLNSMTVTASLMLLSLSRMLGWFRLRYSSDRFSSPPFALANFWWKQVGTQERLEVLGPGAHPRECRRSVRGRLLAYDFGDSD